jgi:anaerobic ribonucleoside-triphosphate reductase activating protein
MPPLALRIHHKIASSLANGPGRRAVVWVQGCSLACPGCFNPETHPVNAGLRETPEDLVDWLQSHKNQIEGLTVSGGEPFQQAPALARFLEIVRAQTNLSVLVFTGYTLPEIQRKPTFKILLPWIDVLIAGRYEASQRVATGLLGSANKTVHFLSARYSVQDLQAVPEAEVWIDLQGQITLSGIDPLPW